METAQIDTDLNTLSKSKNEWAALPLSPLVASTQRSSSRVGLASAGTPRPIFPRSQAPTPDQS